MGYYLSMLSLAKSASINHSQLNIFDELGQQEIEWESMQAFLRWIACNVQSGQQVIITTSEERQRIESAVAELDVAILNLDGFILQRI